MKQLFVGLMSGTSADGIDATLVEITDTALRVLGHLEIPYSPQMYRDTLSLCRPGDNEIDRMGRLDHQIGHAFANAAKQLLVQHGLNPSEVTAIGSHGQTVRHRPNAKEAFTLQIGDPNLIAEITGIDVVADFRRRDMAAGGQGAPLVPAFHRAMFFSDKEKRVIANIGGMANITDLTTSTVRSGFDTGPGNVLMDAWINKNLGQPFDRDGQWANGGQIIPSLLDEMLQHPFFKAPPPKSTGREEFHQQWLNTLLTHHSAKAQDVQATLLELTCQSLMKSINQHVEGFDALYVCGGGAFNDALMTRLNKLSQGRAQSTAALNVLPHQVEGAAFAWLAHQTLNRKAGNLPVATGARHSVILGGIYPAG